MNKFDPEGIVRILAQDEARSRMPADNDGSEIEFDRVKMPLVKVGTIFGRAISYTRSHGLIEWKDRETGYNCQWFRANEIHRVPREQWQGQALDF